MRCRASTRSSFEELQVHAQPGDGLADRALLDQERMIRTCESRCDSLVTPQHRWRLYPLTHKALCVSLSVSTLEWQKASDVLQIALETTRRNLLLGDFELDTPAGADEELRQLRLPIGEHIPYTER